MMTTESIKRLLHPDFEFISALYSGGRVMQVTVLNLVTGRREDINWQSVDCIRYLRGDF